MSISIVASVRSIPVAARRRGIGAQECSQARPSYPNASGAFQQIQISSGTRPGRRHYHGTASISSDWGLMHQQTGPGETTVFGTPRLRTGRAPDRSNCQGRFTSECWPMPLVLLMLLPGMFVAGFASGFGVRARISRRRRRKRAAARLPDGDTSRHFMHTQTPPLDLVGDNANTQRRRASR